MILKKQCLWRPNWCCCHQTRRVLERLPLTFARRFVAGEASRSIKSDPQFIATREYVLSRVFEQREAFS